MSAAVLDRNENGMIFTGQFCLQIGSIRLGLIPKEIYGRAWPHHYVFILTHLTHATRSDLGQPVSVSVVTVLP